MKLNGIMNCVTRGLTRANLKLAKHSPEILIVAGVVGVVTSAVMACKATTKLHEITEKAKEDIDAIHKCTENGGITKKSTGEKLEYTEEDSKKDLTIVYTQTAVNLAKLYAPSIILGAVSIAGILMSNNILRKRGMALAAAYTAVDTSLKKYRERVVNRFGEDVDRELTYNIKAKEVEETVTDENGETKTVKKTVEVLDRDDIHGPYSMCFDEYCRGWEKDPEHNKFFLLQQQRFANEKLKSAGYLCLNDVYAMLGRDRTKLGQIIGWKYDKSNPNLANCVDFGIFNIHDEAKRDFVNGREVSIWLDFNVDGNLLELI